MPPAKKTTTKAAPKTKTLADYLPATVWLMKTEPDVFSFEDLTKRPGKMEKWDGVRNYQARNFMRDEMKVGHRVLFYHSSTAEPGIVGEAAIVKAAEPDFTALDSKSEYFDEKATRENPRWVAVTVGKPKAFKKFVPLSLLRHEQKLKDMLLLRPGQRLSIQPVSEKEYQHILTLSQQD